MNRSSGFAFLPMASLLVAAAAVAHADPIILKGSDYFQTGPGTTFAGVSFIGVPINPGTTGNTDTIVRRLMDINFTGPGTSATNTPIPIELVALQLVSVMPVNFGLGNGFYYLTLQSARGGPPSGGQITAVTLDGAGTGGTFNSFFDVFFDIRLGALNGPIAFSDDLILSNNGATWRSTPLPTELLIPGLVGDQNANLHTNKGTGQLDFFGSVSEAHPSGAVHNASPTLTPEPMTLLLTGSMLILAGLMRRRIRGTGR